MSLTKTTSKQMLHDFSAFYYHRKLIAFLIKETIEFFNLEWMLLFKIRFPNKELMINENAEDISLFNDGATKTGILLVNKTTLIYFDYKGEEIKWRLINLPSVNSFEYSVSLSSWLVDETTKTIYLGICSLNRATLMIVNGYNSDDPTSKVVNVSINKMKDKNIQGSLFSVDKGQVFMLVLASDPTKKRSHLIYFEIESQEQVKHKFEEHYRLGNHSWNARSVVLYLSLIHI
eukprot:TRINITY_DN5612_c0_g1_i11.p1 TRINITY_DN5612_c0_g1~~TRINITY_DN5612_c0_g1_i11.p1  ORF type:complete len:232 (+),score=18.95 TRINITY_DN5612_c0_g1_i11:255-950(+)